MELADKLELLAKCIREKLPWEFSDCNNWYLGDPEDIDSVVTYGYEIRIKDTSEEWTALEPSGVPPRQRRPAS